MRDGKLDGMQDFDSVIKGLIENGTVTLEDGLTFATNPNNLLLSMKGVTAGEEFLQRGGKVMPMSSVSDVGSMLSMLE
jgi:Tfp pilus assembly ATPase PilU